MKNAINIIYTDANKSQMKGLCFHCSTKKLNSKFLHYIVFEKITNDYFFAHFQEILLMFGFITKRNIKLVFGMNTIEKKTF